MVRGECHERYPDCPLLEQGRCYTDTHHVYWPKNLYRGIIESTFRNLPENLEEDKCRFEHRQAHQETPPEKPDRNEMIDRIIQSGIFLSVKKRKAIYGE